ncbi:MAG TPA: chemotaxis protein CheC [Methanoregulaceae archaeon]|nr:chemotaxis protein CheC [Methanoregulaceae archaeon]
MQLTEVQLDAIRELGNIGAAHAATTLSQMLMCQINMSVPEVRVVDIGQIYDYIGDEYSAMVVFQLQGEIEPGGYIVLLVSRESALRLTNTMLGMSDTDREFGEMDQSALLEIGNIMISAFLDGTAMLLGIVMLPSPPEMAIDMAHAGMESLLATMDADIDEVILFRTELMDEEHMVNSDILFLPDTRTLIDILRLLENVVGPM